MLRTRAMLILYKRRLRARYIRWVHDDGKLTGAYVRKFPKDKPDKIIYRWRILLGPRAAVDRTPHSVQVRGTVGNNEVTIIGNYA